MRIDRGEKRNSRKKKGERIKGELWTLFYSFFKIGLFTIGGGMAMVPLIEKAVVEDKKWMTDMEMVDCLAVSQSLPGVVAINTATYIGNSRRGLKGAICATVGVIMPSFIIILILASVLTSTGVSGNKYIQGAFEGIKAAVCGLLAVTTYRMGRRILKGIFPALIAAFCIIVVVVFKITVMWAILVSAVLGVVYHLIICKRGEKL